MTSDAANKAAAELALRRREHRAGGQLAAEYCPTTPEEGYAAQQAFIKMWGEAVGGWKAGATAEPVQARFGLKEPFLGPVFSSTILHSPAVAEARLFAHKPPVDGKLELALEVEFAFRVGKALAPQSGGYTAEQVLGAIDALVPALEIITPRFEAVPFGRPGEALADCGLNGGMILGKAITDWRGIDLVSHKARQLVDGQMVAEGTGALVLGNPYTSLVWLVNALTQRFGVTLTPGQILTTGSMTGIVYVKQGTLAVGDFGTLGQVAVRFT